MHDERKAQTPHDALVRAIFGTPARMAEELRAILPPSLARHIDFEALSQIPTRFADGRLEGSESDLLFRTRVAGREALLYFLIEHQSAPDRFIALRVLRYFGRILDDYRRAHPGTTTLPVIIPIVLFHDARPWPYPLDFGSLFDLPDDVRDELAPYLPDFRFLLEDLAAIDSSELAARPLSPLVFTALFVLKHARHAEDFFALLRTISARFSQLADGHAPDEQVSAILTYVLQVGRMEPESVRNFTRSIEPKLEELMKTTAEQLEERGEARGQALGEARGQALGERRGKLTMLRKLVQLRFGVVTPELDALLESASSEQLDSLLERALVAQSAQQLLRDPPQS